MPPRSVLSEAEQQLLRDPNLAVVSTLRADGSIHAVPTWVDLDGPEILLNSEVTRVWARNAVERTTITVLVTDRNDPYRYVSIGGRVVGSDAAGAVEHGDRMARKYLGQDTYPFHQPGDVRVVLRVQPLRVSSSGV